MPDNQGANQLGSDALPYLIPRTIQEMIDQATEGDTVLIPDGTYTGEGNKNLDFYGKNIVLKSINGPESVVIDCEWNGRGFYFHSGEDQNAKVEGFTILHGRSLTGGGGIHAEHSSPIINNCIIRDSASYSSIHLFEFSSMILNCEITGNRSLNRAGSGAGLFCQNSELFLENCSIHGNDAYVFGGGMYINSSEAIIMGCEIANNRTSVANEGAGGGIYCNESDLIVSNCIINSNSTDGEGGGIACLYSEVITQDIYFSNNGALMRGGAIYIAGCFNSYLNRCILENNVSTEYGGCIYSSHCDSIYFTNCTLFNNYSVGEGGGLYTKMEIAEVRNCVLWGNYPEQIVFRYTDPIVQYSDIEGGWPGEGNIDADPLFTNPDSLDFSLLPESPCIDTGDPTFEVPLGGGSLIDMGAYEYRHGWNIAKGSYLD